jgi:hypothetical protein
LESLHEVDIDVHIRLSGGTAPEDIAPYRSAELKMPMDKLKWVDVAEYRAEHRNLFHKVDHFAEQDTMDEIAVYIVVHRALKRSGSNPPIDPLITSVAACRCTAPERS